MSIHIVKKQIELFLSTNTPEVIAIKGAWGVGKTFSWNKFLLEARKSKRINLQRYSYVSLFGVDSLEELKFMLFQNVVQKDLVGTEPNIETFKSSADSIVESLGRKSMHLLGGIPLLKNFSPVIKSLSFLSLQKTLICIDDFERKGKNLSARDVMGLISVLKEQKACKVAIILNDESLEGDNKSQYQKFREKVIDLELAFKPTPEECADIALDAKEGYQKLLIDFTVALGIDNIRIIMKVKRLAKLIMPLLSNHEIELTQQALQSLTLFAWCFYSSNEEVPDFEYVKNIGYKLFGLLDKEEQSEKEKKWNSILQDYNYRQTDEFDLQISQAVQTGYVNEEEFLKEADRKNSQIIHQKSEGSFSDAWGLYRDNFENNQEEVVKVLYDSFQKNVKYISPTNLNGTVRLFRDLGNGELADQMIELYIKERSDDKDIFDLEGYHFAMDISDEKIIREFNRIHESNRDERSLKDVLSQIAGKSGWGGGDEEILANASVDDYYNLFKEEKGKHLSSYVNTCLQFGRFSNASEKQKTIGNNATEALRRIAKESPLNQRRVSMYGIKIETNEKNA